MFVFGCNSLPARAGEAPKLEKWFDVSSVQDNIIWEKKLIVLTSSTAMEVFTKKSPNVVANWREKIDAPIENLPNAKGINEAVVPSLRKAKDKAIPYAELRKFSPYNLQVMILKPAGSYRWHHYYECLASFQIPRSAAVDALFNVRNLERPYRATIQGIGYGHSEQKVLETLGEPDFTVNYQPVGYFELAYFGEDVTIEFQNNRVKTISRGVSPDWKKKAEQGIKHGVRF